MKEAEPSTSSLAWPLLTPGVANSAPDETGIENGLPAQRTSREISDDTAHKIGTDPWYQAAFVITTGINSAYILSYSASVMVPLGWVGGTVGLILAAAISLYANTLLASLHETGGIRHIRYRDLAGHIFGRKAYALTWTLQYVNLFMINTGLILLAGQSLKAVYVLYSDDGVLKLPYCTAISGFVCVMFAIWIPHLSDLRIWLCVSTVLSLTYIIIVFVLCLCDGISSAQTRDYTIPGTLTSKIYDAIGACATLLFVYNAGILPEIQATVRPPAVKNMKKALLFIFTIGILPMYAVTFIGYWAFGSSTSSYLLNSVNGPVWVKTLANIAAFFQTVISLHVIANPIYEYMDTRFGSVNGGPFALHNILFRVLVRGGYLSISTFLAALLPFVGDFTSLTGAASTIPLTFVFACLMYLRVKKNKLSTVTKGWLWMNVIGFGCFAVVAFVADIRTITIDSRTFHLFADL